MESEDILTSIMSKLKEYKDNPLPSPDEEKERQKNLIKMFCIYTSLKKREKARQKQEKHDAIVCEKQNIKNQLNNSDNCEQNSVIDSCRNDRISSHNLTESINIDETVSESETLVEYVSDEPEELCSDFSPTNNECIKTERSLDEAEESFDGSEEEHENSLNQFLILLSERLKKLPYRQRSKLEIEFFRRLIEVEEYLQSYTN